MDTLFPLSHLFLFCEKVVFRIPWLVMFREHLHRVLLSYGARVQLIKWSWDAAIWWISGLISCSNQNNGASGCWRIFLATYKTQMWITSAMKVIIEFEYNKHNFGRNVMLQYISLINHKNIAHTNYILSWKLLKLTYFDT